MIRTERIWKAHCFYEELSHAVRSQHERIVNFEILPQHKSLVNVKHTAFKSTTWKIIQLVAVSSGLNKILLHHFLNDLPDRRTDKMLRSILNALQKHQRLKTFCCNVRVYFVAPTVCSA